MRVVAANFATVTIEEIWNTLAPRCPDVQLKVWADPDENGKPKAHAADQDDVLIPVISYDTKAGAFVPSICTSVQKVRKACVRIELDYGDPLLASPEHHHLVFSRGWTASSELAPGDQLITMVGLVRVTSVSPEFDEGFMYDLTVEGTHAYLANGVVTHNSHMVAQLAKTQAMAGYKVAVVPLEMSRTEFTIRTLANIAGIDSLKMSRKTLTQEEKELIWKKFRRYQRRVERTGGRLTFYNPSSDVTIEETLAALHAYDPDIIYIDYIGLLKGAASEDQWRQLGNIARAAKVYAGNHKKVVVLAAQVDEEGRIRYSQTIKEHATLAFTFAATKETREQHILNINMLKGRNQQLIDFRLHIDYSTSTLKDPPASSMDSSSSSSPSSRTNNPGKPAAKKPAAKREKELAIELD